MFYVVWYNSGYDDISLRGLPQHLSTLDPGG